VDESEGRKLRRLGYAPKWVEYGFLSEHDLAEQWRAFDSGDEPHTEHLRYSAFLRVLERPVLSDAIVAQYVELAALDPDRGMAQPALVRLLEHPRLTESQFARLREHPLAPRAALVQRIDFLRQLRASGAPLDLLRRCAESGDRVVHEKLLERRDLPRDILKWLHARGATRAVRNVASQRLASRAGRG
jgi:hypothetical protein